MYKLANKVSNIIKRAYITLTNNDSSKIPYTQISYFGKAANAELIMPYGMNCNPPIQTLGLAFSVSAQEENQAFLPYSGATRFNNLVSGEVAIGNPTIGSYIKFLANGDIEINAKNNVIINGVQINTNATTNNFGGKTNLGAGGVGIARLGDTVEAGGYTGTITSASSNNTSN